MEINELIVLTCAFRYALGRSSYVVSAVVDEIHKKWDLLDLKDKALFVDEIVEQRNKPGGCGLGTRLDQEDWLSIVSRFEKETGIYE